MSAESDAFVRIGDRKCLLDAQLRLNVHATFGTSVVLLRVDSDASAAIVPLESDGRTASALAPGAAYRLESVASLLLTSGDLESRVARLEALLAQSTEKSERQHNAAVADKLMDLERKRRESLMYDSVPLPDLPNQPAPAHVTPKPEPAPLKRAVHAEIKAVADRRPTDLQKPVAPVRRPPATRPPPPGSSSASDAAPAKQAEPTAAEATPSSSAESSPLSPVLSGRKLRATVDAARNAATRLGETAAQAQDDSPKRAASPAPTPTEPAPAAATAPAPAVDDTDTDADPPPPAAEDAPTNDDAAGDGEGSESDDPYADISDGEEDGTPAEPAPLLSALPMVNSTIDTTLHRSRPSLGNARRRPQRKVVARAGAEEPRFTDAGGGRGGRGGGRALPAPRGGRGGAAAGRGGGRGGATTASATAPTTTPAPAAAPVAADEPSHNTGTLGRTTVSPTPSSEPPALAPRTVAPPTASSPPTTTTTTEPAAAPPVTSAAATAAAIAAVSPRPVAPPRARTADTGAASEAPAAAPPATSHPQLTRTMSPTQKAGPLSALVNNEAAKHAPPISRTLSPPPRSGPIASSSELPLGPPPLLASRDSSHKPLVPAVGGPPPLASRDSSHKPLVPATSPPPIGNNSGASIGPPPALASRSALPPGNAPPAAPAAPNSIAAKQNNLAAIVARQAADQMAGRQGRPMTRPSESAIAAPPMPGPPTSPPPPTAVAPVAPVAAVAASAPPPAVPAEPPAPIAPSPVAPKAERLKSPGPSSRKGRDSESPSRAKSPSRHKSPSRAKSPSGSDHRSRAKSPSTSHRERTHRRNKKDGDSPQGSGVGSAAVPAGDTFLVLFDYAPSGGDGELKLRVGDIISKLGEESGWWEGTNTTTGETGWFSPDFVKPYKRSN